MRESIKAKISFCCSNHLGSKREVLKGSPACIMCTDLMPLGEISYNSFHWRPGCCGNTFFFYFISTAQTILFISLSVNTDHSSGKRRRHDAHAVCRVFRHAGPTGQRYLGDGFPPAVPRKLSENSALSAADGWSAPSSLPALHRDNGMLERKAASRNSRFGNCL